jgi:hypothetical protein
MIFFDRLCEADYKTLQLLTRTSRKFVTLPTINPLQSLLPLSQYNEQFNSFILPTHVTCSKNRHA